MFKIISHIILIFSVSMSFFNCNQETVISRNKIKNVVIIVMDGARYSETWGDSTHLNIPHIANDMAKEGVIYTHFYNDGPTYTLGGHSAITTGIYADIDNTGLESPKYPSIFQYYNKTHNLAPQYSWIITSKDKLAVLADCSDSAWKGKYLASTDCGINGGGVGSGYRSDSLTYIRSCEILTNKHPNLVLINFKDPDEYGHNENREKYLQSINKTDEYIYLLWNLIRNDDFYRGNTTLFVTNDHGRHLDSVQDGFFNHGDGCEGCRHIFLYAFGPKIKKGAVIDTHRGLIDIPATVGAILNNGRPVGSGKIMTELFD